MTGPPKTNRDGSSGREFDLEERTAQFGEAVIAFANSIPVNRVIEPIIGQLVRAATNIGANYCEADDAGSRKEFMYRISVGKREPRESKPWLAHDSSRRKTGGENARAGSPGPPSDLRRDFSPKAQRFTVITAGTAR